MMAEQREREQSPPNSSGGDAPPNGERGVDQESGYIAHAPREVAALPAVVDGRGVQCRVRSSTDSIL